MTEDDDQQPVPENGTLFFMQLPPEVQEYISHQRMHLSQTAHEVKDFFEGLSEEQLRHFRGLLGVMVDRPEAAHYYMGLIGGLLSQKFNVCLACSKNHDKELAELADHEPVGVPTFSDPNAMVPSPAEEAARIADIKIDMGQWSVKPLNEGDYDGPVICTGPCEGAQGIAVWTSLEARKEAKPGVAGCTFCQQKEAWG